jgi:hypothetical protein
LKTEGWKDIKSGIKKVRGEGSSGVGTYGAGIQTGGGLS